MVHGGLATFTQSRELLSIDALADVEHQDEPHGPASIEELQPRLELEAGDAPPTEQAALARSRRLARLAWVMASLASLVAVWALWSYGRIATASRPPMFVDVGYPKGVEALASLDGGFAISPDGTRLAMIGVREGARRLFVRELERPEAVEIPDSQGVNNVTFSPDGRSIAFTLRSGRTLVRLSLTDRQRGEVTGAVDIGSSITWGSRGIVYARRGGLSIVSPDGGEPRVLTTLDPARHEVLHADPFVLPEGRTVLFSSLTTQPGAERIEAVSVDGGPRSVMVERAVTPIWSATGHLLFGRDGVVLAALFDVVTATLRGAAVPVIREGVVGMQRSGTLGLRLSSAGTLAYLPADAGISRVVSVGRNGAALPLNLPLARHANPRLSPDGRRLLVGTADAFLEALDMTRGARVRLTAAAPGTNFPSWSSDGERVVFRRYNSPYPPATRHRRELSPGGGSAPCATTWKRPVRSPFMTVSRNPRRILGRAHTVGDVARRGRMFW